MNKKIKLAVTSLFITFILMLTCCGAKDSTKELLSDNFIYIEQGDIGFPEELLNSPYSKSMAEEYQNKAKHLQDVHSRYYEKISKIPGVESLAPTFLKNGKTALMVLVHPSISAHNLKKIPSEIEGISLVLNKGELLGGAMLSTEELISEQDIIQIKKSLDKENIK